MANGDFILGCCLFVTLANSLVSFTVRTISTIQVLLLFSDPFFLFLSAEIVFSTICIYFEICISSLTKYSPKEEKWASSSYINVVLTWLMLLSQVSIENYLFLMGNIYVSNLFWFSGFF